jgi:hypothetical protein
MVLFFRAKLQKEWGISKLFRTFAAETNNIVNKYERD